jgi:hypothetical protein
MRADSAQEHEGKMRSIWAICCTLLLALATVVSARAQNEPDAFVCSFSTGTSWSYEDGSYKSRSSEPLQFKIENVDLDAQSASLVTDGREKPGTLKIVRAINANHFLEVVNEGFLNLTTIYDKDSSSGLYPAVHSRHLGLLGQPVFAQYAGTCKAE